MLKRISVVAVSSVVGLASLGFVASVSANEFSDVATVISSTPIFERISVPRQQCYTEQVSSYEERRVNRVAYDDRNNDRRDDRRYEDNRVESRSNSNTGAGTVLGAVIGGAIGRQFGQSSGGRDRGTVVGAILGGVIGHSAENSARDDNNYRDSNYRDANYRRAGREEVERVPVTRDVQRCQTVADSRDEIRGYDVRYRYQGREYATRLAYDPGPTMPVNVEVRPVSRGNSSYQQRPDSRTESRTPTPTYSHSY